MRTALIQGTGGSLVTSSSRMPFVNVAVAVTMTTTLAVRIAACTRGDSADSVRSIWYGKYRTRRRAGGRAAARHRGTASAGRTIAGGASARR